VGILDVGPNQFTERPGGLPIGGRWTFPMSWSVIHRPETSTFVYHYGVVAVEDLLPTSAIAEVR